MYNCIMSVLFNRSIKNIFHVFCGENKLFIYLSVIFQLENEIKNQNKFLRIICMFLTDNTRVICVISHKFCSCRTLLFFKVNTRFFHIVKNNLENTHMYFSLLIFVYLGKTFNTQYLIMFLANYFFFISQNFIKVSY